MEDLLRNYIAEVVAQAFEKNPRCGQQLRPKGKGGRPRSTEDAADEEVEEMSVAGGIAGFTAPLGYSSEDVKGPGVPRRRKSRRQFARWK